MGNLSRVSGRSTVLQRVGRFTSAAQICALACSVVLGASGCSTTEATRFYMLTPLARGGVSGVATSTSDPVRLGIGPIELPHYLDGPQLVSRAAEHRLELAEFHHWAEPLKDNVTRVVADNLSTLLRTEQVSVYPWDRDTPIDVQVLVKVFRLDANLGQDSVLIARWRLADERGRNLTVIRKTTRVDRVAGNGYEAVAAAMSRALQGLSQEIAVAIRDLALDRDSDSGFSASSVAKNRHTAVRRRATTTRPPKTAQLSSSSFDLALDIDLDAHSLGLDTKQ